MISTAVVIKNVSSSKSFMLQRNELFASPTSAQRWHFSRCPKLSVSNSVSSNNQHKKLVLPPQKLMMKRYFFIKGREYYFDCESSLVSLTSPEKELLTSFCDHPNSQLSPGAAPVGGNNNNVATQASKKA